MTDEHQALFHKHQARLYVQKTGTDTLQWVTLQELSAEIRVPLRTVYKWRTQGRAPRGAMFGKHIRMLRSDVNEWIAARMDADAGHTCNCCGEVEVSDVAECDRP